jgi:hypothetical protein
MLSARLRNIFQRLPGVVSTLLQCNVAKRQDADQAFFMVYNWQATHFADMPLARCRRRMSAFGGKADMTFCSANVCF